MKVSLILLFLIIISPVSSAMTELTKFKTDFCTNYKEGTRKRPDLWKHCCLMHDMYFWAGGNKQERYDSDLDLRRCIEETGAYYQAKLIYYAVRFGSYSPIKYPDKKWNNGWRTRPDFQTLSREDIDAIENELSSGYDFISPEMKETFIHNLRSRMD